MNQTLVIDLILVPQGAEFKTVCRGLRKVNSLKPEVLQVPIGTKSVKNCLEKWCAGRTFPTDRPQKILLMGLCGSLSPQYRVGDAVIYRDCLYASNLSNTQIQTCSHELFERLEQLLKHKIKTVRGLRSDRLIWSATEKARLGQLYTADVVDMEGFAVIETLQSIFPTQTPEIGIIRVVSDDCDRDIPNLEGAIDVNGSLQTFPLAMSFLKQPIAAARLIRGSLKGLKALEQLTGELFSKVRSAS
jgi:hypothetical protein